MKKWFVGLGLALMLSSAALAEEEKNEAEASHILVAYVSRAGENYNVGEKDPDSVSSAYAGYIEKGNTEIMAKMIAQMTGAGLYAITTEDPYPEDYASMLVRAQEELDQDARPALAGELPKMEGLDTLCCTSYCKSC